MTIWNFNMFQNKFQVELLVAEIFSKDHKRVVKKLREAREKSGLTQADVAKRLGVTQSYISKIEAGQVSISIILLKKLSKVYGIDIRHLL